jgi:transposase
MEKVTTVGIDLAKSVFSLHGVDGAGRLVLRRTVRRDQLIEVVAGLAPCLIGMEACPAPGVTTCSSSACGAA